MRADVTVKESCPCGGAIEVSGYTPEVRAQMVTWRRLHRPHMKQPEEKSSDPTTTAA